MFDENFEDSKFLIDDKTPIDITSKEKLGEKGINANTQIIVYLKDILKIIFRTDGAYIFTILMAHFKVNIIMISLMVLVYLLMKQKLIIWVIGKMIDKME